MSLQLSRLGLYFLLLTFTVVYQIRYPLFINSDFLLPLYCFVAFALSVSLLFLLFNERTKSVQKTAMQLLLPLDAICITGILYQTGLQNSLYLFFYLYLIFVSALSFRLRGAIYFSVYCSVLLSIILLLDANTDSNSKTFLFLINNVAFFVVAYLGGNLSEQLQVLGQEVRVKEKNIQELKNINSLIVDNMKTGLIYIGSNKNIVQHNQAGLDILRLSTSEELGAFVDDLGELGSSKKVNIKELLITKDEDRLVLEVMISELIIQEQDHGYLILFQDVTEKKQFEEKMKNNEKLAAVGQLAAGIAHEIRNPLASMSGSIQLLASSFENLDDEQKKLIAITLKETDRLNNLISEFLEFVRPNLPLEDKVSLKKLLEECIDIVKLNPKIPQVQLVVRLEDFEDLQCNRDKLKQVFLNILINASQANSKQVLVELYKKEGLAHVVIRDDGNGMKEEVRKKIFEPFYTTKPRGTGLGLAIVHKIIEAHSGSILVESELGKGSTFKIELPVT